MHSWSYYSLCHVILHLIIFNVIHVSEQPSVLKNWSHEGLYQIKLFTSEVSIYSWESLQLLLIFHISTLPKRNPKENTDLPDCAKVSVKYILLKGFNHVSPSPSLNPTAFFSVLLTASVECSLEMSPKHSIQSCKIILQYCTSHVKNDTQFHKNEDRVQCPSTLHKVSSINTKERVLLGSHTHLRFLVVLHVYTFFTF